MTLIRLGTVAVLVTLLLCITSCNRLNGILHGPKPSQVVDLPSMIGKSSEEISKIVGVQPYKDDSMVVDWDLPEGRLAVFKEKNGDTSFISYSLNEAYSGFASSAEMAALVNVDVQRQKPEEDRNGNHSYKHVSASGKTFSLVIERNRSGFFDVRISGFGIGG